MTDAIVIHPTIELYLTRQWKIFPVHWLTKDGKCSCGDPDCQRAGKHPLTKNGLKDATCDRNQINGWLKRWPNCRWGLRMGSRKDGGSGLFALDIDPLGFGSWELMIDEYQNGPFDTVRTRTPRNGEHYIFLVQDGQEIPCSISKFAKGIDVRGEGGYIIVPPSNGYHFELSPEDYNALPAPRWILDRIEELKIIKTPAPPVDGKISAGTRNSSLASLAGTMRRRGFSQSAIEMALLEENDLKCDPPLSDAEVMAIAKSIARYEPAAASYSVPVPIQEVELIKEFNATDLGNAERIVAQHGADIRYCHIWGKWLVWDDCRWAIDQDEAIMRRAHLTARSIYYEAANAADPDQRKRLSKWARASENRYRLISAVALAQAIEGIPVSTDDLDSNPYLLNCLNGTLNLKRNELINDYVELRPHNKADLITKRIDVEYDPEASCPLWLKVLNEWMNGRQDIIDFLQKAIGYSLTGVNAYRILFILHGGGANGKSVFLETVLGMLGSDYAMNTPTETVVYKHGSSSIPNDVARLKGARFVTINEVEKGQRLAESKVKQMTGNDTLSARFMRQEWFDFIPEFKIWIRANHKPQIKGTDEAIWDRIRLVPFDVRIPREKQDTELAEKLKAEYSGILNWAIEGCMKWQAEGLGVPDEVRSATSKYRAEMDLIGAFIDQCCIEKEGVKSRASALYREYKSWCEDNSEEMITGTAFGTDITERGYKKGRDSSGNYYEGIGLLTTAESESKDVQ